MSESHKDMDGWLSASSYRCCSEHLLPHLHARGSPSRAWFSIPL